MGAPSDPGIGEVNVEHIQRDRFEIAIRDHRLWVDQPLGAGGDDSAQTPTELFVASLASCVAFYARRFLTRHDLPTDGLVVTARFTMADRPTRVGEIALSMVVPNGVPRDRQAALLAVASHCTVHNSLAHRPSVSIDLIT